MKNWLYPGAKVVCVDDRAGLFDDFHLTKGSIYTVERVVENGAGLIVHEAYLPRPYTGWHADRFRPLRKRSTDISIFKAMLEPSKQGADA